MVGDQWLDCWVVGYRDEGAVDWVAGGRCETETWLSVLWKASLSKSKALNSVRGGKGVTNSLFAKIFKCFKYLKKRKDIFLNMFYIEINK